MEAAVRLRRQREGKEEERVEGRGRSRALCAHDCRFELSCERLENEHTNITIIQECEEKVTIKYVY